MSVCSDLSDLPDLPFTGENRPPAATTPHRYRIQRALEAMRIGLPVVLFDDDDRENEADLIVSAEHLRVETMAQLIRDCSGIVCLCLSEELADGLDLPPMVARNSSRHGTAFTVSIEARDGVSTGVSAADRLRTVQAAVREGAMAQDLVRPGHVFPLRARTGGVLMRRGHTEGAVDLARMAGLRPAAVLCELMNANGTMMRRPEALAYARLNGLPDLSIEDLVFHRSCETGQGFGRHGSPTAVT